MNPGNAEEVVNAFFDDVDHPGLPLPDGWFGTSDGERSPLVIRSSTTERLIVELDDELLLSLTPRVDVDKTVSGKAKAVCDDFLRFRGRALADLGSM